MTTDVVAKARSFLIRGLAVLTVVLAYAWGSLTASVLSVPGVTTLLGAAGISSLILTTTISTPANAWDRRRRRRRRRRRHRGWDSFYWWGDDD